MKFLPVIALITTLVFTGCGDNTDNYKDIKTNGYLFSGLNSLTGSGLCSGSSKSYVDELMDGTGICSSYDSHGKKICVYPGFASHVDVVYDKNDCASEVEHSWAVPAIGSPIIAICMWLFW